MSCHRNGWAAATAGVLSGIPARVGRQAFYAGAAAGVLLGSRWLARRLQARWAARRARPTPRPPPAGTSTPVLAGPDRVEPLAPADLKGRQCAGCRARAETRSGLWYPIEGAPYCQDCAGPAARQAGLSLALPAPARRTGAAWPVPALRTTLKAKKVDLGPVRGLDGYVVLARGQTTGLTLTPAFKREGGQVQLDRTRWFVNYSRAGKALAGPYRTPAEAQGLAAQLARLDFTRPVEAFTDAETRLIAQIVKHYRAEVNFMRAVGGE